MNKLLTEYTFQLDMNVEWGDMDALQHVNNVEYFKYFQKARIAYFEKNNSIICFRSQGFQQYWPQHNANLFTHSSIQTLYQ